MLEQIQNIFQQYGTMGLAINAFIESFFIAPPPDFLLIAMDLAAPQKALFYALVCTLASALGGATGWSLGKFGGRPLFNIFFKKHQENFNKVEALYERYGTIAVIFAAITPVPYNVFALSSGILNMNFAAFILISIFGRGARFFIVSIFLMFFGDKVMQYFNYIFIAAAVVLAVFYYIIYKQRHKIK